MIDPFTFPVKKQGDRIVISCVVSSGDQPIKIKWTKDGHAIPPDMGIKIQVTDINNIFFEKDRIIVFCVYLVLVQYYKFIKEERKIPEGQSISFVQLYI